MSALTALVLFSVSFMVVAMLFKMPVSYALGFSSLLVLAFSGKNTVTVLIAAGSAAVAAAAVVCAVLIVKSKKKK